MKIARFTSLHPLAAGPALGEFLRERPALPPRRLRKRSLRSGSCSMMAARSAFAMRAQRAISAVVR